MYPCSSAPAHLNSPCWVCDRSYGMRLQRAKQLFCCDFWWDSSWRGSTFSIPQDLVSFAVCIFVTRGEGRRLGHCVTAAGDTGTPQDERLEGKALSVSHSCRTAGTATAWETCPYPLTLLKLSKSRKIICLDYGALDAIFSLPFGFWDYELLVNRIFMHSKTNKERGSIFTTPAKYIIK